MNQFPSVLIDTGGMKREVSLTSLLHQERTIYICQEFNDHLANIVVQQLLHFGAGEGKEKDVNLYINSGGGVITSGMAIMDTIYSQPYKVNTYCLGHACSMGAFLLAAGTGTRYAQENSKVMIHQPLGGFQGQASDIEIRAKEILQTKAKLNKFLSAFTGQPLETIERDTDRDNFMTAEQALAYGLVDEVIKPLHRYGKHGIAVD